MLHTSPEMTIRRPPIPSIRIAATLMPTIIASAARSKRATRRRFLPPPRMVPRRPTLVRSLPRGMRANLLPTKIRLAMAQRPPSLRPIRSSADPRMRRLPAIHSSDVRRTRLMRPMRVLRPTPLPANRSTAASTATIRRPSRSPIVPRLAPTRSVPRTMRGSSQRSRAMPSPMRTIRSGGRTPSRRPTRAMPAIAGLGRIVRAAPRRRRRLARSRPAPAVPSILPADPILRVGWIRPRQLMVGTASTPEPRQSLAARACRRVGDGAAACRR